MQNNAKWLTLLNNDAVKSFISTHLQEDAAQLALQYKGKVPFDLPAVTQLISLYRKAEEKLPLYVRHFCALTQKSYEQSSSETTAFWKSSRFSGKKMLNLTGGLGVDDVFFARNFVQVVSLDPDEEIHEQALFNNGQLSITNIIRLLTTAENYLQASELPRFDLVYADPDRRPGGKRTYGLADGLPDIAALQQEIFSITDHLLVKASPLLHIPQTIAGLTFLKRLTVVAVKNEVKEILLLLEKGYTGPVYTEAVNLVGDKEETCARMENEAAPAVTFYTDEKVPLLLLEPNMAIVKAGLSLQLAATLGVQALIPTGNFLVSDADIPTFPGRKFRVIAAIPFHNKTTATYLKDKRITRANVVRRNFRLSAEEIRKKLHIREGGNDFLLFFDDISGEGHMYHAEFFKTA